MQRRQFDGNTRSFINTAPAGGFADGVNRLLVGEQVSLGVIAGQRRLAQHIVGITEATFFQLAGIRQRFGDGFPGHELLAHQPHRHVHALTHQRLAAFADDAVERAGQMGFVVSGNQLTGDQQSPGGGVDEQRGAAPDVRLPVAGTDFVADQRIPRGFVRDAQQRFRQTH